MGTWPYAKYCVEGWEGAADGGWTLGIPAGRLVCGYPEALGGRTLGIPAEGLAGGYPVEAAPGCDKPGMLEAFPCYEMVWHSMLNLLEESIAVF